MSATLPRFLIVGAAKAGTTSLYMWLRQHPGIFLPSKKEAAFFANLPPGADAIRSRQDYEALFASAGTATTGEASVCYLPFFSVAIPNIRRVLGNPKIIMILRDPVERALSHYHYYRQLGLEDADGPAAFTPEHRVRRDPWQSPFNPYLHASMYAEPVRAYLEAFTSVKVLFFEALRSPAELCRELFTFLEVSQEFMPTTEIRNVSGAPRYPWVGTLLRQRWFMHKVVRYMPYGIKHGLRRVLLKEPLSDDSLRRELKVLFSANVTALEALLGKDLSTWK